MTFVLVVVVARFNSWDYFFFAFFKNFPNLGLGVRDSIRVRSTVKVRFTFHVYYVSTKPNCTLLVRF